MRNAYLKCFWLFKQTSVCSFVIIIDNVSVLFKNDLNCNLERTCVYSVTVYVSLVQKGLKPKR